MSGFFDEPPPPRQRPTATAQPPQRSRALLFTGIVLVGVFFALSVFTGIWTDRLWFRSLDYGAVFTKLLSTRVLLFLVFGLLLGAFVTLNVFLAYRFRPLFRPASLEQAGLDRYRQGIEPVKLWLLLAVGLVFLLFGGASGAGKWRDFLMWRNANDFGETDPFFNKDIGYYVFDLPWLHYLVGFGMTATVIALVAAGVVHYLYGGIRLQDKHDRFSGAAQVHLSVLAGLFVLFKAVDYWLDRYDITSDASGLITGVTFTDDNAVLPSKEILTAIALITALLFFANIFRRTWMLPAVGSALLVLSAVLLGALWPGVVQQFQVSPSEPDKESPYIQRNIEATRTAYSIDDVEITPYPANISLSTEQLQEDAQSLPGIRLLDPQLVSETFEQLQQVRGYYSVSDVLDVDRYPVNDEQRDMVLAVRELNQGGLPEDQRNWANLHTVYTHGFGVIAAYGNQRNSEGVAVENDGEPEWAEQDIPPQGDLTQLTEDGYQPRIYFGEQSPQYSIVGRPDGADPVEFDIPEGEAGPGSAAVTNTYDGAAGVPVGNLFHKLLYAVKFSEPNIVLSSRVNENSRILYDRHPRLRVQKVAPWLTVDGDPYPAVVDGRVVWILDAYTVTDRYPQSEKRSLSEMTRDSLQPQTAYATLPTDQINYIRNSVKAVVDAYDGTVTLYEWDEQDPILKAWSAAFPGIIEPRDSIPEPLLEHMRYPEDLFKVQRNMLAEYHVTNPTTFYEGSDQWEIPQDPTDRSQNQPPYRLSVRTPSGGTEPVFSHTSVYVPKNRQNLAAFISVDADASEEEYGQIRILRLPGSTQIPGPSQIANQFGADQEIQDAKLAFTRTNSEVIDGNLLTLPVGDGLLYVQPLYTQRQSGEGRYPVLRYVLVSFGKEVGFGPTLTTALNDVLGEIDSGNEAIDDPGDPNATPDGEAGGEGDGDTGDGGAPAIPGDVESLLQEAEDAFAEAQQALQDGDLATYQEATERARDLVAEALEAAGLTDGAADGGGGGGGGADGGQAEEPPADEQQG